MKDSTTGSDRLEALEKLEKPMYWKSFLQFWNDEMSHLRTEIVISNYSIL